MHELGEHFAKQCFLVRAILLPGHGTRPGDMINVDFEEWIKATQYGIEQLAEEVNQIYLAGFSTGGVLALHYVFGKGAEDHPESIRSKVNGLILLAPAIELKNRFAWAADGKLWFNRKLLNREVWRPIAPNTDLVKYESFNINAGAQVYKLTAQLMPVEGKQLRIPLFIALSEDDQTVESKATIAFFENRAPEKSRMMLYTNNEPFNSDCPDTGICRRQAARSMDGGLRILDFAHTSIPLSAKDPYYGRDGRYVSCVHYLSDDECDAFEKCTDRSNHDVFYGERSKQNLKKGIVRRLTWNPDFDTMIQEMDAFVKRTLSENR